MAQKCADRRRKADSQIFGDCVGGSGNMCVLDCRALGFFNDAILNFQPTSYIDRARLRLYRVSQKSRTNFKY